MVRAVMANLASLRQRACSRASAPLAESIYGRMSDREIYAAILAGDHARFIALAEELASSAVR